MQKSKMTTRVLASLLTVITAASPIATYAADLNVFDTAQQSINSDNDGIDIETKQNEETKFLFIKLNRGGSVVLNKGEADEKNIVLEKLDDKLYINVYDKEGILVSSKDAEENKNTYLHEVNEDSVVTVDAISDKGYILSAFNGEIDGIPEDVGFDDSITKEDKQSFSYPFFIKENTVVDVKFDKEQVDTNEDLNLSGDSDDTTNEDLSDIDIEKEPESSDEQPTEDLLINENSDENSAEEDIIIPESAENYETASNESDSLFTDNSEESEENVDDLSTPWSDNQVENDTIANAEENQDLILSDEANIVETPIEDMVENDLTEPLPENVTVADQPSAVYPEEEEFFVKQEEGVEDLDQNDFTSARLVIMTDDKSDIIDEKNIIGNYGNIYLMQYKSIEQSMNAYAYYSKIVQAIEPDMKVEMANAELAESTLPETDALIEEAPVETAPEISNDIEEGTAPTEILGMTVTNDMNPVALLNETPQSDEVSLSKKVIALIDTGTSIHPNVIDRISLIDDVLVGNTHGDEMVKFITEENPDAKILSIRAVGNDGYGSYSSIVSAIEYAINSNVDIINLSMYSKKTLATSILESQIQKAIDSGIVVVGSAGNDGADVVDYIPGSIPDVWSVGSVDKNGIRKVISNYGDLVDYYIVSETTSEAAARFSGFVSAKGTNAADKDNSGLIFKEAKDPDTTEFPEEKPNTDKTEKTIYDPIIENYVRDHADKAFVGEGQLQLANVLDVSTTLAAEEQLRPGETIDSLNKNGDGFRFITQNTGRVPVYGFSEDSDYFVAYADVMHNNKKARLVDYQYGINDLTGRSIDGTYFDKETGLLYIPVKTFYDENGQYTFSYHRAQLLYALSDYSLDEEWTTSAYSVTEESNGDIEQNVSNDEVLFQYMNVQVGKHMDVNDMLVSVNGFPIDGKLYAYNPETGNMLLGFSSSVVQSVWVQAHKSADAPDVEPGMKIAGYGASYGSGSYTFDQMNPVNGTVVEVNKKKLVTNWSVKTNALTCYGRDNIASSGSSVVLAYREQKFSGIPENKYIQWITQGVGSLSGCLQDGKVWDVPTDALYEFGTRLASIDDTSNTVAFDMLPSKLLLQMECTHLDSSALPGEGNAEALKNIGVIVRCAKVNWNAPKPYAIFGIYTQECWTQHGMGLFKVLIKPEGGAFKLLKKINHPGIIDGLPHYKIKTHFQIYTDKACKKPWAGNADAPKGVVKLEGDSGQAVMSKTINEMPGGTYYIKELGRCVGTVQNKNIYQFKVIEGAAEPTKTLHNVTTDKDGYYIGNDPFRGRFIIKKTDPDGKPLEGAIFRVRYFINEKTSTNKTSKRTWYFRSDKNGEVRYDGQHLVSSWKNPSTKKVYTSRPLYKTNKDAYYLPLGHVYITEVEAPKGYVKDNKEYYVPIQPDKATQMQNGVWTSPYCPVITINIKNSKVKEDDWKARVQVKKIRKDTHGLAGSKFGVYYDSECTMPTTDLESYITDPSKHENILTSGSDGMTEILTVPFDKKLDEATLYCREEEAPKGYAKSDEVFELKFTKAEYLAEKEAWIKSGKAEKDFLPAVKRFGPKEGIVNEEGWKVRVNAKKIDDSKKPLAGATFEVSRNSAFNDEGFIGLLKSEANGMTNILEAGVPLTEDRVTLYCREKEAPKGFVKSDKIYTLTFLKKTYDELVAKGDTTGELKTFGVHPSMEGEAKGEGIVNKEGWKVQVDAKKVDEAKKPLAGAVFGLFEDRECIGEPIAKMTSKDDGMTDPTVLVVSDDALSYTVYCKEIEAPKGYAISKKVEELSFTREKYEELKKKAPNPTEFKGELKHFFPDGLVNKFGGWILRVNAKKVSGRGDPLPGAKFGVYEEPDCSGKSLGTLTSGANGMTNELTVTVAEDKEEITLYCKETSAPSGYEVSKEIGSLQFLKATHDKMKADTNNPEDFKGELKTFFPNGLVNNTPTPTPTPPQQKPGGAGVYVLKTSKASKDILDLDSYELDGAEFSLTPDRADGTSGTFVTKKDGVSNTISLVDNHKEKYHPPIYNQDGQLIQAGWTEIIPVTTVYTVKETKAPKGHKMNFKPYTFSVTMPADKNRTIEVPFEDEPYFCKNKLEIEKLGVKGNKIKGVVFKVEFFDSTGPDASKLKRVWYLESDENGMIYMDDEHVSKRLNFKSDAFFKHDGKIVMPIDGYLQFTEVAAPAEYVINDKPFGMATGENANLSKRVYNDMELCEIKIKKYEDDGVTPIAGVEFEIKFLEETIKPTADKNQYFGRLLKEGESYTSSTDENGELVFKGLDHGKYQITEVRTHSGNTLLKEPIIVTVPMTMTQEEANDYGNVDFDTAKEDKSYTDKWFFYSCLFEITNHAKFIVPMTGGNGIWKIGFIGMGVLAMIGTGLIVSESSKKKRKRKKKK